MTSPEIIEEEAERLLKQYFNISRIRESENPYKEFLRQVSRMKQLGIIQQLKENYTIANRMFKHLNIRNERGRTSLSRKEFKSFNFGAIQKSMTAVFKAVATRTGKRQVVSTYKGITHSFEKWHYARDPISVRRDIKGRFADKWNR